VGGKVWDSKLLWVGGSYGMLLRLE